MMVEIVCSQTDPEIQRALRNVFLGRVGGCFILNICLSHPDYEAKIVRNLFDLFEIVWLFLCNLLVS